MLLIAMYGSRLFLAVLLAHTPSFVASESDELSGFLFVSAPRDGRVAYVPLDAKNAKPITLIETGLKHPQGIAIDQKRKRLFVTDPDARKIYRYQIAVNGKALSTDGAQTVVSHDVESRWVAVDSWGNVFFTEEPGNTIRKIAADQVLRGTGISEIVYGADSILQVSDPGGIAVDNFHLYWTNKQNGMLAGVVVKGAEVPVQPVGQDAISVLATSGASGNIQKAYGICTALDTVYYTDSEQKLWGVKKNGGAPKEIANTLTNPRGCVYDGDGTVYVADRSANKIFAFAGNMKQLVRAPLVKAFDFEDAFGLAFLSVLSAASRLSGALRGLSIAVAVTFVASARGG